MGEVGECGDGGDFIVESSEFIWRELGGLGLVMLVELVTEIGEGCWFEFFD